MGDFFIVLSILIVIGIIIIVVIIQTATNKKNTTTAPPTPTTPTKKTNFGSIFLKIVVVIVIILVIIIFFPSIFRGCKKEIPKDENTTLSNYPIMFYPISGKEVATMDKPIKAFLDPTRTNTRIIGPGNGKYVLESDPSRFFICNEKPEHNSKIQDWALMPAGNYLIYPEGIDKIIFYWYQIY